MNYSIDQAVFNLNNVGFSFSSRMSESRKREHIENGCNGMETSSRRTQVRLVLSEIQRCVVMAC